MCVESKMVIEANFCAKGKIEMLLVSKKMCNNDPSELRDLRVVKYSKGSIRKRSWKNKTKNSKFTT